MDDKVASEITCMNPECGNRVPFNNDVPDNEVIACPHCGTPAGTAGVLRAAAKANMRKGAQAEVNRIIRGANSKRR